MMIHNKITDCCSLKLKHCKLRFYKNYTQANCEMECLSNYTKNECGCVKFSMPRENLRKK